MDFKAILKQVRENKAPDLHLKTGMPPIVRLASGDIHIPSDMQRLSGDEIINFAKEIIPSAKMHIFETEMEADFSFTFPESGRFRANLYCDKEGPALAIRAIDEVLPEPETYGIPNEVLQLATLPRGLVLVTGPTGSGKSTTLAMIIDAINRNRKTHIITIEDPIEFIHKPKQSVITQRELGSHTISFPNAIRSSLRQNPDIVMIGEMRDPETIMAALTLAETGHLVFSTLHTQDAPQTVNRIIDVFPQVQRQQIMSQLSLTLKAIVAQTLLPTVDGAGRVCAFEILLENSGVTSCIKDGKVHQLYSMMELGRSKGMRTLDEDLAKLVKEGKISTDIAMSKARDIAAFEQKLHI